MVKYAMVIDLFKCTGCGACDIGCKNENNVPQGFHWASHITLLEGTFPNLTYTHMPTLCNHCENAPCVEACPVDPKAIYKNPNGMTLNSSERCIGCRACQGACPYGVIYFNEEESHPFWRDDQAREITEKVAGNVTPYYNPNRARTWDGSGIRPAKKVEKCSFCDHRVLDGDRIPYCCEVCPPKARTFGDLEDPNSEVSKLLQQYKYFRLQEDLGTEPQVYYIRKFSKK